MFHQSTVSMHQSLPNLRSPLIDRKGRSADRRFTFGHDADLACPGSALAHTP